MTTTVIAITGGASGIGAAVVRSVARRKCSPVILDIDQEGAERVLAGINSHVGGRFIYTDVSDHDSIREAAQQIETWTPRLDGLVTCAGVLTQGPANSYPLEEWNHTFDVNVRGVWLTVRETYPLLREARGVVVTVASIHAYATRAGYAAYAASKAATVALVKGMAADFSQDGVRVLGVAPSGVATPLTEGAFDRLTAEDRNSIMARYPLGRLADADEIAEVIDFLLVSATYMTGTVVLVDGGVLATL